MLIPRNVKGVATKVLGRGVLQTQKYSPEILTVVGIAGFVTAAVLAARATLKLEETLDKIEYDKIVIRQEAIHEGRPVDSKDLFKAYLKGSLELTKLYGPAFSIAVGSTASILVAHGIMKRRNVALVAAYTVLEKSFGEYRKRVISEYGEDKDKEFKSGVYTKEITKNGKKVKVVDHVDRDALTEYQRFFDSSNVNWSKEADYNTFFLTSMQNYYNDRLIARGHVFLNEVYDALGFEHTSAGSVVGWLANSEKGDNFIDFGMDKWENIVAGAHIDGTEGHILLEFNVDGTIFDKI
jgi:hypothetical protein